jgi:GWxTD domain-containing protein
MVLRCRKILIRVLAILVLLALVQGSLPGKTNYKKWLNQEVVWIISKAEREDFGTLRKSDEKEQFMHRFWKRRDPSPSTEKNEYKEEHYRRLLYANEAFGEGVPGWKSDRGRIYILHGPPDNSYYYNSRAVLSPMKELPSSQQNPNTLVWIYHRIRNARHALGEMRLVFQPSMGMNTQTFALSDSKAAQERAELLGRHFGASDPNIVEADVRYKLVMAGPPRMINAKGADIPSAGQGEFGKYMEDLFRSPGDMLEETEKEVARREKAKADFATSANIEISYGQTPFSLTAQAVVQPDGYWLVPVRVEIPLEDLTDDKLDIYAAVLDSRGSLFDEFIDTLRVDREGGDKADTQLAYSNAFVLPSGQYRLRVAVREVVSRKTGFGEESLDLNTTVGPKVELGAVVLANRLEVLPKTEEGADSVPLLPGDGIVFSGMRLLDNPSQTFYGTDYLFLFVQLRSVEPGSKVSLNGNFIRDGEVVRRLDPRLVDFVQTHAEFGTAVPLEGFAPGDYVLQLQALDHSSKSFDIRRVSFRVLEPLSAN